MSNADDYATGTLSDWLQTILIVLMSMVLGFVIGVAVFYQSQRIDCATLCINRSCVQTCPATTMEFRE